MELNLPKALVDFSPWNSHSSPIWILAHYSLRRNLHHYPFPEQLSVTERSIISDLLKDSSVLFFITGRQCFVRSVE